MAETQNPRGQQRSLGEAFFSETQEMVPPSTNETSITLHFIQAMVLLVLLLNSLGSYAVENQNEIRVVVFTPTSENNTYWPQVYSVLNAVAGDLNIRIEKYEFDVNNRFAKHQEGVDILRGMTRPDAAIFSVAYGQAKPLLEVAEQLGIPAFVQGPLFPAEFDDLGQAPRKKYKNWIGYFYQDEMKKGYLLAKTLIASARKARSYGTDQRIHIVGVGGDFSWHGSKLREMGLMEAVKESSDVLFHQTVPTMWTSTESRLKTRVLLERYPETSVVWTASDQLAMGAVSALEEDGKVLNQKAFVGGLDLSVLGLQQVKDGRLTATVASPVFTYAEVLTYLYDYLNGFDFIDELGTEIKTTLFEADSQNVDQFLSIYASYEAIDFKKFSKAYNQRLSRYDFSLERLIEELPKGLGSDR